MDRSAWPPSSWPPSSWPRFEDVLDARRTIAPYLRPTPVVTSPALDRLLGCRAFVKCENTNPTRAFKVRGGINLISRLSPGERARGVITASTGNHGQSIAYAAALFGVRAIIGVPRNANPVKLQAMRDFGAEIVEVGRDFDDARGWVERTAETEGYRYVHSGNEPSLIAGVATSSLELIETVPDLDVIIVPVGGGSGACGHTIAAKVVNPRIQIIGVQAAGAPAVYHSWKEGRWATFETLRTRAEGLATRAPFALTLAMMRERLDDLVLVTDEEMEEGIRVLLETTGQVAELAGAAAAAAARRLRDRIAGRNVGLILSGGNITMEALRAILAGGQAARAPT
ncbi:MAG: threonine/serine dehydratase [Armatimonadota bacterium]|nr:threonine/serine dehydratase [Armatimonadota bacterium]MDR7520595.1 threonine/serine dehydratase [Armatimonadota bacterium]MDR7548523.1 threonine/serine dehydratase [Armatimonadota bacterium]